MRGAAPLLLAALLAAARAAAGGEEEEAGAAAGGGGGEPPPPPSPADVYGSQARADEVVGAKYGDVLPSTGRVLSFGSPAVTLREVQRWAEAPLPTRTRDYHNHHMNSDTWDHVPPRDGDVVVATCGKSGTTVTQAIVANLIHGGELGAVINETTGVPSLMMDVSPWVDMRLVAMTIRAGSLERQTYRRHLKTHLPLDGIPFSPKVKYIQVTRDIRDATWSWLNHWKAGEENGVWEMLRAFPGLAGPPVPEPTLSGEETFAQVINPEVDSYPFMWSHYHHLATWWQYRHLPNVLLLHYTEIKKDKPAVIRKLADFLGIGVTEEMVQKIVDKTSLEYMRETRIGLLGPAFGGEFGARFFNKGKTGTYWKDKLTTGDIRRYEGYSILRLGKEAAHWMMTGEYLHDRDEL